MTGTLLRATVVLSLTVLCTFNIFSMTQDPDNTVVLKSDSVQTVSRLNVDILAS